MSDSLKEAGFKFFINPKEENLVKDIKQSKVDDKGYIEVSLKIKVDNFSKNYNPYVTDNITEYTHFRHSIKLYPLPFGDIAGTLCLEDYTEHPIPGVKLRSAGEERWISLGTKRGKKIKRYKNKD